MFGNLYQQIQSFPSPKIWEGVKRGIRTISELGFADLALSSFVNPTAVDESVTDTANASLALTFWNNGGPTGDRTLQDDATGSLALSTFINYTAVDDSVTDTGTANLALTAAITPTVSGDRTLQDDSTAFIALTKWNQ